MVKNILAVSLFVTLILTSCQQQKNQEADLLIGSWVEPNPINEKEVQGLKLNEDGTAESVNMATLVYKKWWKENGKLILVFESIGNGLTTIDTTKFEIIKLNEKELEIRDNDYIIKYKRQ